MDAQPDNARPQTRKNIRIALLGQWDHIKKGCPYETASFMCNIITDE
jgi:hypothetical protein